MMTVPKVLVTKPIATGTSDLSTTAVTKKPSPAMTTTTPAIRVSHSTIFILARFSFVMMPTISVGAW
jgi:hypothetical protein